MATIRSKLVLRDAASNTMRKLVRQAHNMERQFQKYRKETTKEKIAADKRFQKNLTRLMKDEEAKRKQAHRDQMYRLKLRNKAATDGERNLVREIAKRKRTIADLDRTAMKGIRSREQGERRLNTIKKNLLAEDAARRKQAHKDSMYLMRLRAKETQRITRQQNRKTKVDTDHNMFKRMAEGLGRTSVSIGLFTVKLRYLAPFLGVILPPVLAGLAALITVASAAITGLTAAVAGLLPILGAFAMGIASIGIPMAIAIGRINEKREALNEAYTALLNAKKGTDEYKEAQLELAKAQKAFSPVEREINDNIVMLRKEFDKLVMGGPSGSHAMNIINEGLITARQLLPTVANQMNRFTSVAAGLFASMRSNAGPMSGRMNVMMQSWPGLFDKMGRASGHFFSGMVGLLTAAAPLASWMAQSLLDLTVRFDEWANSSGGQNRLMEFFSNMQPVITSIIGALWDIIGAIFRIGEESRGDAIFFFDELGRVAGDMVPWIEDMTHHFRDLWPEILSVFAAVGSLSNSLMTIINPILDVISVFTELYNSSDEVRWSFNTLFGLAAVSQVARMVAVLRGLAGAMGAVAVTGGITGALSVSGAGLGAAFGSIAGKGLAGLGVALGSSLFAALSTAFVGAFVGWKIGDLIRDKLEGPIDNAANWIRARFDSAFASVMENVAVLDGYTSMLSDRTEANRRRTNQRRAERGLPPIPASHFSTAPGTGDGVGAINSALSGSPSLPSDRGMTRVLNSMAGYGSSGRKFADDIASMYGSWISERQRMSSGSQGVSSGLMTATGAVAGGDIANTSGLSPAMMSIVQAMSGMHGVSVSSGYRPGSVTEFGNVSLHSLGKAADFVGSPAQMQGVWNTLLGNSGIKELIYNGMASYNGGSPVPFTGANKHYDHVHVGIGDGVGAKAKRTQSTSANSGNRPINVDLSGMTVASDVDVDRLVAAVVDGVEEAIAISGNEDTGEMAH